MGSVHQSTPSASVRSRAIFFFWPTKHYVHMFAAPLPLQQRQRRLLLDAQLQNIHAVRSLVNTTERTERPDAPDKIPTYNCYQSIYIASLCRSFAIALHSNENYLSLSFSVFIDFSTHETFPTHQLTRQFVKHKNNSAVEFPAMIIGRIVASCFCLFFCSTKIHLLRLFV